MFVLTCPMSGAVERTPLQPHGSRRCAYFWPSYKVVMLICWLSCWLNWCYYLNTTQLRSTRRWTRTNDTITTKCKRGADKSLARPGKKQATATKLGIYSTYSPWSSIHFLAHRSNFASHSKKNWNVVRPTRRQRQQWPPRRKKNDDFSVVFFFSPGNKW